jgi:hypothetical protein
VSARSSVLMHRKAHLSLLQMRLEAAAWFPPSKHGPQSRRPVTSKTEMESG